MSGYKETVKEDSPVVFLTFDSPRFDKLTRKSLDGIILDESGNERHGTINDTDPNSRAYRLGTESLINIEHEDNLSICFAHYDRQIYLPQTFTPAWVQVNDLPLPTNKEVTLECHFRKYADFDLPTGWGHYNYTRPFISGYGIDLVFVNASVNIGYNMLLRCAGADYGFTVPFGEIQHLIITIKDGAAKIYLNCIDVTPVISPHSTTYWSISPDVYIGGTPTEATTGMLYFDQIAFYDRVLTDYEIARHYKKTKCYTDLIVSARPFNYWTLSDDLTKETEIRPLIGSLNGKPIGKLMTFDRNEIEASDLQILINEIRYNACLYFPLNSHINFKKLGANGSSYPFYSSLVNDYTLEFWAKLTLNSNRQACILSMQDVDYPYVGWNLMLNTKNREYAQGYIEFSESQLSNAPLLTSDAGFYNDNIWRHYCIIKRKAVLEMWINGKLVVSNNQVFEGDLTVNNYGCLRIGSLPLSGTKSCEMYMYGLGIYNRAISNLEVLLRSSYSYSYEINGTVTYLGIPVRALIRLYNTHNGEYITESWSNALDGVYQIKLPNNTSVNAVIFNPHDPKMIYRVYTNITPYQVPDYL